VWTGYCVSSIVSMYAIHRFFFLECLCVYDLKGADQRPNLVVDHIQQTPCFSDDGAPRILSWLFIG
jgi:hypothetical protein